MDEQAAILCASLRHQLLPSLLFHRCCGVLTVKSAAWFGRESELPYKRGFLLRVLPHAFSDAGRAERLHPVGIVARGPGRPRLDIGGLLRGCEPSSRSLLVVVMRGFVYMTRKGTVRQAASRCRESKSQRVSRALECVP